MRRDLWLEEIWAELQAGGWTPVIVLGPFDAREVAALAVGIGLAPERRAWRVAWRQNRQRNPFGSDGTGVADDDLDNRASPSRYHLCCDPEFEAQVNRDEQTGVDGRPFSRTGPESVGLRNSDVESSRWLEAANALNSVH